MAAVRGFFAILIGVAVAGVIGGAYDYLKLSFIPNPTEWVFIWPYVFMSAGAISSITAIALYLRWSRPADSGAGKKAQQRPLAKTKASKGSAFSTSSDVPGMPTFDVDKIKAENAQKEQGQR